MVFAYAYKSARRWTAEYTKDVDFIIDILAAKSVKRGFGLMLPMPSRFENCPPAGKEAASNHRLAAANLVKLHQRLNA